MQVLTDSVSNTAVHNNNKFLVKVVHNEQQMNDSKALCGFAN